MPRIETTERTFFKFDELTDTAKEKAREWWRDRENQSGDTFWSEYVIEDFATICGLLGLDIKRYPPVRTMGGETRHKPSVYWSGFWSQGDGACFEGYYSYEKGSVKAIRDHAPDDADLVAIAERLRSVQAKYFFKLNATIKHTGCYYHEHSMSIEVEHDEQPYLGLGDAEDEVKDCLRDLARWLYRALEREYSHVMSDESVDESIRINEYEFDEEGNIA